MGCSDSKSTGTENTTSKPDNNKGVKEANNVGKEMSEEKKRAILQMR